METLPIARRTFLAVPAAIGLLFADRQNPPAEAAQPVVVECVADLLGEQ